MRRTTWRSLVGALGCACALLACGGDDESGAGGGTSSATATTDASTTAASTSATTVAATDATATSGAGGGKELLNGCDEDTAEDMTGMDGEVDFVSGDAEYDPPCVKITLGTHLHITAVDGTFGDHPIVGGTVKDGVATKDPSSPIFAQASDPFIVPYFQTAGAYPYYCNAHYAQGAMGVVYVEP